MPLHFSRPDYQRRIDVLCKIIETHSLDGVLLFKPESLYYLTGYDSLGYVFFQGRANWLEAARRRFVALEDAKALSLFQ